MSSGARTLNPVIARGGGGVGINITEHITDVVMPSVLDAAAALVEHWPHYNDPQIEYRHGLLPDGTRYTGDLATAGQIIAGQPMPDPDTARFVITGWFALQYVVRAGLDSPQPLDGPGALDASGDDLTLVDGYWTPAPSAPRQGGTPLSPSLTIY
jgi:hypothetical protein